MKKKLTKRQAAQIERTGKREVRKTLLSQFAKTTFRARVQILINGSWVTTWDDIV